MRPVLAKKDFCDVFSMLSTRRRTMLAGLKEGARLVDVKEKTSSARIMGLHLDRNSYLGERRTCDVLQAIFIVYSGLGCIGFVSRLGGGESGIKSKIRTEVALGVELLLLSDVLHAVLAVVKHAPEGVALCDRRVVQYNSSFMQEMSRAHKDRINFIFRSFPFIFVYFPEARR